MFLFPFFFPSFLFANVSVLYMQDVYISLGPMWYLELFNVLSIYDKKKKNK